jgi:hypothetical protein
MVLSRLRRWRREREAARYRVSEADWQAVERDLPFLDFLPPADRPRLRETALHFLADKEIAGAHGFEVTDPIRLSIALQACLPVLGIGLEAYEGWVGIVVYPGDFVIPRNEVDEDGIVHEYEDPVVGEAWDGGPVLLSWFDRPEDADGMNVVIHEFAHKLDMNAGDPDGLPPLHADMDRRAWASALGAAYEDFCRRVDAGEDLDLDPYAAQNPSEFFAVMSEAFFETPLLLRDAYPEVYRQLALFYRQDPAQRAAELEAIERDEARRSR